MSEVARKTEPGRECLYKALSSNGNPEFATAFKVNKALDIRLHASDALSAASY